MDIGTFAIGCMNYEINRDNGNLPEHDIEFQQETGIGPVFNGYACLLLILHASRQILCPAACI